MAEVTLKYWVPVDVEIDTDTGEVVRVVVIDKAPVLCGDENVGGATFEREHESNIVTSSTNVAKAQRQHDAAVAHAIEIADLATWPSWEMGY